MPVLFSRSSCSALSSMYHISCVVPWQILFEETLYQKGSNGKPLVDLLTDKGILLGIKVDKGVIELPDCDGETTTQVR
jgi:fructose-bisphosphate aldolase class 1